MASTVPPQPLPLIDAAPPQPGSRSGPAVVAAAVLAALAAGVLAVHHPLLLLTLLVCGVLVAATAVSPPTGVYTLIVTTPLIGGMQRGVLVPLLRPSEAIIVLVGGALIGRAVFYRRGSASLRIELNRVDASVVALAITGSLIPVLWLLARGRHLTQDDALYAFQIWKYLAVYLVVRAAIRDEHDVRNCLWAIMASSAVVAFVAIVQGAGVSKVSDFLSSYYGGESLDGYQRGSSTLDSALAVGDVMIYSFSIAAAWLLLRGPRRRLLIAFAAIFIFGAVAAGQFSSYIGMLVAVVAVGALTGYLGRMIAALVPVGVIAAASLWSVISRRLSGINPETGIPKSWEGRLTNLHTYFWPRLDHYHWVLGVRPSARVPAPERWRKWVWIESGHTYLLWTGGILFLLAFFGYLWAGLWSVLRVARSRADAIGIAAIAAFSSLIVLGVLMTFDAHLVLRGAADLNFTLLALALVAGIPGRAYTRGGVTSYR